MKFLKINKHFKKASAMDKEVNAAVREHRIIVPTGFLAFHILTLVSFLWLWTLLLQDASLENVGKGHANELRFIATECLLKDGGRFIQVTILYYVFMGYFLLTLSSYYQVKITQTHSICEIKIFFKTAWNCKSDWFHTET